jgi:hypothetical protein
LQLRHGAAAHPGSFSELDAGQAGEQRQLRHQLLPVQLGAMWQLDVPQPLADTERRQPSAT